MFDLITWGIDYIHNGHYDFSKRSYVLMCILKSCLVGVMKCLVGAMNCRVVAMKCRVGAMKCRDGAMKCRVGAMKCRFGAGLACAC